MTMRTEVTETPGRSQPYAVWFRGRTVFFTDSKSAADARLATEQRHYEDTRPRVK